MDQGTHSSFVAIIDLWPSLSALAADIDEKYPTVAAWKQRNSIPSAKWARMVAAAEDRKFKGVTYEALGRIASAPASPDATP